MPDADDNEPFDFGTMRDVRSRCDDAPDYDELAEREYWRETILKKVHLGEASPEEAEAKALKRGAAPFCDLEKRFDTFGATMELWTPEMALSWIKTRDVTAVHRHHQPSYRGTTVWVESGMQYSIVKRVSYPNFLLPEDAGPTRKGYKLVELEAPEYPHGYFDFGGSLTFFPDIDDLFPELRQHLLNGVITAFAVPPALYSSGIDIPRHEWLDGSLDISPNNRWVLTTQRGKFTHVHFRIEGMLLAYPPEKDVKRKATEIRPWRTPMPEMKEDKRKIVEHLQSVHPAGLPAIRPLRDRDRYLRSILPADYVAQWFDGTDEAGSKRAEQADDAFRKAMYRLLKEALAPAPEKA